MALVRFIQSVFTVVLVEVGVSIFFVPLRADLGWRAFVSGVHRRVLITSCDTVAFLIVIYLWLRWSGEM